MDKQELAELRKLLHALPDSRLRDLALLCVLELEGTRMTLAALGQAIKDANK